MNEIPDVLKNLDAAGVLKMRSMLEAAQHQLSGGAPSHIFSLVPDIRSAVVTPSRPEHLLSRLASPEPPPRT